MCKLPLPKIFPTLQIWYLSWKMWRAISSTWTLPELARIYFLLIRSLVDKKEWLLVIFSSRNWPSNALVTHIFYFITDNQNPSGNVNASAGNSGPQHQQSTQQQQWGNTSQGWSILCYRSVFLSVTSPLLLVQRVLHNDTLFWLHCLRIHSFIHSYILIRVFCDWHRLFDRFP